MFQLNLFASELILLSRCDEMTRLEFAVGQHREVTETQDEKLGRVANLSELCMSERSSDDSPMKGIYLKAPQTFFCTALLHFAAVTRKYPIYGTNKDDLLKCTPPPFNTTH